MGISEAPAEPDDPSARYLVRGDDGAPEPTRRGEWSRASRSVKEERHRDAASDAECRARAEIREVVPICCKAEIRRSESDRSSYDPDQRSEPVAAHRRDGAAGGGDHEREAVVAARERLQRRVPLQRALTLRARLGMRCRTLSRQQDGQTLLEHRVSERSFHDEKDVLCSLVTSPVVDRSRDGESDARHRPDPVAEDVADRPYG